MKFQRNRGSRYVTGVAVAGVCAALLESAKVVLAALPNVEVVTLLTALFGYCFGGWGVLAAITFVTVDLLIYGFGTWTVSYYLYWSFVALVFWFLKKRNVRSRWLPTITAVLLTVWFGVLTSLVDVVLLTGIGDGFFSRFAIIYARGIGFYTVQILCNAVLFPLLFPVLVKRMDALRVTI